MNLVKVCANLGLLTDFYSTFFGFNLPWALGGIFKEMEQFCELWKAEAISVEIAFLAVSQVPMCTKNVLLFFGVTVGFNPL